MLAVGGTLPVGAGGFARQHRLDRRIGAFERDGEARDLGRDIVDALAQQRVLDPLRRPGLLRLALHRGDFLLQLGALGLRLGELVLDQRLFLDEAFGRGAAAARGVGELGAQIDLGLVPGRERLVEP